MFVVHDSVSGVYDRPMCARSEGEMIRSFGDIAKDSKHPIGQHPEHYKLFYVGVFDDNSGMIDPCAPKHVINAIDCLSEDFERPQLKEVN